MTGAQAFRFREAPTCRGTLSARPALAGVGIAQLEEPTGLDAADVDRLRVVIVHDEEPAIVGNGEVIERLPGYDLDILRLARCESINFSFGYRPHASRSRHLEMIDIGGCDRKRDPNQLHRKSMPSQPILDPATINTEEVAVTKDEILALNAQRDEFEQVDRLTFH